MQYSFPYFDDGEVTTVQGRVHVIAQRLIGIDLSPGMLRKADARGDYDKLYEAELTRFLTTYPAAFDAHLKGITDAVEALSKNWLGTIVIGIAGGAAGLLALGKVAIKQLKAIQIGLVSSKEVTHMDMDLRWSIGPQ